MACAKHVHQSTSAVTAQEDRTGQQGGEAGARGCLASTWLRAGAWMVLYVDALATAHAALPPKCALRRVHSSLRYSAACSYRGAQKDELFVHTAASTRHVRALTWRRRRRSPTGRRHAASFLPSTLAPRPESLQRSAVRNPCSSLLVCT